KAPQYPTYGPTITTTTVHWHSVTPSRFFQLQDGGYGAELDRLVGLLRAPLWLGRNRLVRANPEACAVPSSDVAPKLVAPPPLVPRLPSPVDAFFDANKASDFGKLVSAQLREAFVPFLRELQVPLLFPAVVGRTVEDSIVAADDRIFGALDRWKIPFFARGSAVRRWLRSFARRAIRWAFGRDDE